MTFIFACFSSEGGADDFHLTPVIEGRWPGFTRGTAKAVKVVGENAYVADDNGGLAIVDVSNPEYPVRIGAYDRSGFAQALDVSGSYAYVVDSYGVFRIFDVSHPDRIIPVGKMMLPGSAHWPSIHVLDGRAYVAAGPLYVLDVSNPKQIILLGTYYPDDLNSGFYALDVRVVGRHAFVAGGQGGMFVLDVSDPVRIAFLAQVGAVGSSSTATGASSVEIEGSRAYVGIRQHGLAIYDISNRASPIQLAPPCCGSYWEVRVAGKYAFALTSGTRKLDVLDVSNATNIVRVGGTTVLPYFIGYPRMFVTNGYAYVAGSTDALQIFDVSNPAETHLVGREVDIGSGNGLSLQGAYAYVADGWGGIRVIDIADPLKPVRKSSLRLGSSTKAVRAAGPYAYMVDEFSQRFLVVNVSDPANPVLQTTLPTASPARNLDVRGSYAYVATTTGLEIIDVSDPSVPRKVGASATNGDTFAVKIRDSYGYTAGSALRIFDISNPTNLVEMAVAGPAGHANDIDVAGDYVYVSHDAFYYGVAGVTIFQLRNRTNLVRLGQYPTTGPKTQAIRVSGSHAFVADMTGVQVLDVSNPSKITFVASYRTADDVQDISLWGNRVYLAGADGLIVLSSLPNVQFTLGIEGTPNVTFSVEAASSLNPPALWKPLFVTNSLVMPVRFTDFDVRSPQRFYRAREVP